MEAVLHSLENVLRQFTYTGSHGTKTKTGPQKNDQENNHRGVIVLFHLAVIFQIPRTDTLCWTD